MHVIWFLILILNFADTPAEDSEKKKKNNLRHVWWEFLYSVDTGCWISFMQLTNKGAVCWSQLASVVNRVKWCYACFLLQNWRSWGWSGTWGPSLTKATHPETVWVIDAQSGAREPKLAQPLVQFGPPDTSTEKKINCPACGKIKECWFWRSKRLLNTTWMFILMVKIPNEMCKLLMIIYYDSSMADRVTLCTGSHLSELWF